MPIAMSQMTENELDFLYEQALHRESSMKWEDQPLNFKEWSDEELDCFHDDYQINSESWNNDNDDFEAGLEEWEERRRERLAIANEY